MYIHEHLPKPARKDLQNIGWSKAIELMKVARSDGRVGLTCVERHRRSSSAWLSVLGVRGDT